MLDRSRLAFAAIAAAGLLSLLPGCGGGGGTSLATDSQSPDPVVLDIPIAYVKRPAPEPDNNGNLSYTDLDDPVAMTPGAHLYIRPRSSNLADEIDLTDRIAAKIATELDVDPETLGIDIKGLSSSFDGKKLLFSVRAIPDFENNNDPELYTWNLWTYDFDNDTLAYVMDSPLIRNEGADSGGGQDMDPHYLTDDRIVFSSTRESSVQEKELNEGRGQRYAPIAEDNRGAQALALQVIDPDTQEISQISLGRTADIEPATLQSGEVIFSRRVNGVYSLYRVNPSGARESNLYGSHSSDLIASEESAFGANGDINILHPRELPDGRIMALLMPATGTTLGGDVALIDTAGFVELFTPVDSASSTSARAQVALTDLNVYALDEFSPGGKFLSAYPFYDGSGRILVSWSPCRIENGEGLIKPCSIAKTSDRVDVNGTPTLQHAPPLFGLWLYDPKQQTQLPVVLAQEGYIISEAIAIEPRDYPRAPNESDIFDANLAAENQGLIVIDSVYNQDDGLVNYATRSIAAYAEPGTADYTDRPARFLRVLQPVPMPNNDVLNNLPGSGGAYGLLEILGYVPVEPDGSVTVKVPANTPLMLNTLTAKGRRISARHDHWLRVAPGEVLHCVGCHDSRSDMPHGRLDFTAPSQNPGAISLLSGLDGFPGADPALFASEQGQTMAEVYDLRRPEDNVNERVRDLQLQITYSDEWTDTTGGATPDPDIDLSYDPAWNLDPAYPIIAPNLDPALQGRIVISYLDHIQPIWERERDIKLDGKEVLAPSGNPATSCISCHTSNGGLDVPAGQLDLTGDAAANSNLFTISYEELTRNDREQWKTTNDTVADRTRLCTVTDAQGNTRVETVYFTVPAPVRRGSALASSAFFNCFENDDPDQCGRFVQDLSPPPANCTDDGGTPSTNGPLYTKEFPASYTADADGVISLLQTNCGSCHSSTPADPAAAGSAVNIRFGEATNSIAYGFLDPYVDLVNPAASRFVTRLKNDKHNCWSADCNADADQMQTAIETFAATVTASPVDNTLPGGSPAVDSSFNHYGLLSDSELRLISEWLDIGSPFYNNPFDPRLSN